MNSRVVQFSLLSVTLIAVVIIGGLATNFLVQSVEAYNAPYAGKNPDADVTCRSGQVLVYHLQHNQYICTSAHSAAQWVRHGIAEIVGSPEYEEQPASERMDRAEFAKKPDESMRVSELERIMQKVEAGERLSTGEERALKRAYELQLSKAIAAKKYQTDRSATSGAAGGSMLQNSPKQQTVSQTFTSVMDPGEGHESHQLAIILPPSENVYIGRLSFSASVPVQYVMLMAPVGPDQAKGQPIWTPDDGETNYPLVIVDEGLKSGGYFFAGNALALHTMSPTPFTATVSVVYTEVAPGVYPRGTVTAGTVDSMIDPGVGHEGHSLAILLPPRDIPYQGGVLAYTASEPVQLVALHGPLAPGEDKGQVIWTPDGETKYALTLILDEDNMGVWNTFSGNALAIHTMNTDGFTVSYVMGGLH